MGQKVNPHGARVGVILPWSTRWYAGKKNFADQLIKDYELRKKLKTKLYPAGISHIDIERGGSRITVNIHTAKPGIVIGRGGTGVDILKKEIEEFTGCTCVLNILEIKTPDMDAQLVAENIAAQLEKRISFRRALKQAISRSMKAGAKGVKTKVAGRLGGAEIARTEGYHEGTIPLQTLRANIDYGFAEAHTTYGRLGVKVWIYKGQILPTSKRQSRVELPPTPAQRPPRPARPMGARPMQTGAFAGSAEAAPVMPGAVTPVSAAPVSAAPVSAAPVQPAPVPQEPTMPAGAPAEAAVSTIVPEGGE